MRHFAAAKPEFVVFGEELDVGVRRSALRDSLPLPAVFRRCVLFVQHHGLTQEGIYRKPASQASLEKLKTAFELAGDLDLHEYFSPTPSTNHINTAASLLKLYLRSLPENILTDQLRPDLTAAANTKADTDSQVAAVRQLLLQLPRCNYLIL